MTVPSTHGTAPGGAATIVALYGHIGHRDGEFFHRPTIARYLENLADRVGPLTLVAKTVDTSPDEPRLVAPLPPAKITVRPLPARKGGRAAGLSVVAQGARAILRAVAESRSDGTVPVVFSFAPGPLAVGVAIARRVRRFPVVAYFGIDWDTPSVSRGTGWASRWKRWRNRVLQDLIAGSAECAICAGDALARKVRRVCDECHRTVPILDLPEPADPTSARETEAPVREDAPYRLLFVGALTPRKGVNDLLDAVSRLRDDGVRIHLTLVGTGPEAGRIDDRIRAADLEDRVDRRGYVADRRQLAGIFSASDAFVLPSYNEGFPRVLYEAAAAGLPIVATAVGGIPALLEDRRHALLVEPGDVDALVEALRELREDSRLQRTMSRHNRDLVAAYRNQDATEQHARILNGVAARWTP